MSTEIAKKKEEAARKSSSERQQRDAEILKRVPPQTLVARRTDDGFEIRYLKENLIEVRERVPAYLDSDWPHLNDVMLKELLPQVFCVRFVYGEGLLECAKADTVHCDWESPRSHVSAAVIDQTRARPLATPLNFRLTWGRCREFECSKYIDTTFSDPLHRRLFFPVRLCIVENPSFDKKRITLGVDFLSRYLHSRKGPVEAGEVLFGDNHGHFWATTCQKKAGIN